MIIKHIAIDHLCSQHIGLFIQTDLEHFYYIYIDENSNKIDTNEFVWGVGGS